VFNNKENEHQSNPTTIKQTEQINKHLVKYPIDSILQQITPLSSSLVRLSVTRPSFELLSSCSSTPPPAPSTSSKQQSSIAQNLMKHMKPTTEVASGYLSTSGLQF
jgi:hypothetical protein